MDELLDKLNEEQIKPVCDTEGAVLVLAGAGSGKTRVLTSRIAYILREGKASLSQILAITFTNKAAGEMKDRLQAMLGEGDSKWICTIHSMCVKILRQFAEKAGLKPNFSIYSEVERANIIKKSFQELDFDDEKLLKNAKYHIGNAKMLGLDPDQYGRKYHHERGMDDIVVIYEKYDKHLRENNALDFDDLLLETLRLLKRDKEALDYLSDKFKYVLVDEFQDTNAVQYDIIKLLASKHGNLFAVGDDDQSIYGWRGAEIRNILAFDKDFPNAKLYKLERNYRSTKSILKLANCIIKNNSARHCKELWTEAGDGDKPVYYQAEEEAGEALYTARAISDGVAKGKNYSDFAVLMRINALTRSYEQEFTKYGIPYKVFGGFRFFERKEIKDILAYLRIISNPYDGEALERIINVPKRGIGGRTVQIMYDYAQETGLSLYDAAVDCEDLPLPRSAKDRIKDFANLIKGFIISAVDTPVAQLVREVIALSDLRSAYDDGTDEGDGKLANIDEFIASVDDFTRLNPTASLDEYLNQVTLSSDLDDMDDGNYVTLATIHAVKGLEFPVVFVCGLEEKIIPSSRSAEDGRSEEEERRLMYVAITRAKERVYLTRSKSRYLYGHRELTAPSRFIAELAPELGDCAKDRSTYLYTGGGRKYVGSYNDGGTYSQKAPSYGKAVYSAFDEFDEAPVQNSSFKPFWGGAGSNAQQKKSSGEKYAVGTRVRHPKFGVGMVIAVKNDGTVINVAFEGQGIKELSASLAPLTILN
ncbi:MAG: UvrD-helicase domain-containing protein [Clostridia bacterium]|nr:UvrD-helicase domain-containing protein [Clostridia bacterium]